ncbi:hypothetical protein BJY01DRAFT_14031 [Aspergillus pseudoustus]|uniref:Uncharacterized protein n=1 Tax=Aspergillus pseudoustus TaxID=1810923 RepID=A0ABR4JMK0_9EURO
MDHEKADDDTADEVNILILDYMICMAVHEAISGQVQNWVTWLEGTQRLLETVHPATETLPLHLRTKIRVFDIIGLFIQTEDKPRPEIQELTDMATDLVVSSRTTDQKATRDPAVEAAIHIYAHAALRTHRDPGDGLLDDQSIERRREGTPRSKQDIPGYISRILPSLGVPTKTYLEVTGQILRDKGTTAGLFDALARIMMSLEPPVLTQLERGKLNGLSRAQTEELKIRIGMH